MSKRIVLIFIPESYLIDQDVCDLSATLAECANNEFEGVIAPCRSASEVEIKVIPATDEQIPEHMVLPKDKAEKILKIIRSSLKDNKKTEVNYMCNENDTSACCPGAAQSNQEAPCCNAVPEATQPEPQGAPCCDAAPTPSPCTGKVQTKGYFKKKPVVVYAEECMEQTVIKTLEGDMVASVGDMIITGVNGEKYPCKPDIFQKTYEAVEPIPDGIGGACDQPKTATVVGIKEQCTFGLGAAIEALKDGRKVARQGWNGKGMFLYHVPANSYPAQTDATKSYFSDMVPYSAYVAMKGADGKVFPWTPNMLDLLAEDYCIVA